MVVMLINLNTWFNKINRVLPNFETPAEIITLPE